MKYKNYLAEKIVKMLWFSIVPLLTTLIWRDKIDWKNRDFWLQEDSDDDCEDFQDVSNVGSFRSYVWKHFLHSNLRQVGKCKMCGFLSKCNQGNTSGMGRHLKQKHPTVLE